MACDPHWTTYLSALMVPMVAVLGILIAYRQWRTAQNKLKLDLFEKRFAVYAATRELMSAIMTSGSVQDPAMFRFFADTREAKWLLNADIAHYLEKELRHKMLHLQALEGELDGFAIGPARTANVKQQSELKTWLLNQYEVLDEKFAPFLTLTH